MQNALLPSHLWPTPDSHLPRHAPWGFFPQFKCKCYADRLLRRLEAALEQLHECFPQQQRQFSFAPTFGHLLLALSHAVHCPPVVLRQLFVETWNHPKWKKTQPVCWWDSRAKRIFPDPVYHRAPQPVASALGKPRCRDGAGSKVGTSQIWFFCWKRCCKIHVQVVAVQQQTCASRGSKLVLVRVGNEAAEHEMQNPCRITKQLSVTQGLVTRWGLATGWTRSSWRSFPASVILWLSVFATWFQQEDGEHLAWQELEWRRQVVFALAQSPLVQSWCVEMCWTNWSWLTPLCPTHVAVAFSVRILVVFLTPGVDVSLLFPHHSSLLGSSERYFLPAFMVCSWGCSVPPKL